MIKIENVVLPSPEQWKAIIMGARNPLNSWCKSDSQFDETADFDPEDCECGFKLGDNDCSLMTKLAKAGTDHRKFMRMITVYTDIMAPLYWWKEFDTYKVGTVANSCSTMHKIHSKEFALDDFSHEHLYWAGNGGVDSIVECADNHWLTATGVMELVISTLNLFRERYLKTNNKDDWWQMIQLLPSSYNQKRTVVLNYEVLANMYKSRKNHKLDEWRGFCKWIETLPYSELITRKENT